MVTVTKSSVVATINPPEGVAFDAVINERDQSRLNGRSQPLCTKSLTVLAGHNTFSVAVTSNYWHTLRYCQGSHVNCYHLSIIICHLCPGTTRSRGYQCYCRHRQQYPTIVDCPQPPSEYYWRKTLTTP